MLEFLPFPQSGLAKTHSSCSANPSFFDFKRRKEWSSFLEHLLFLFCAISYDTRELYQTAADNLEEFGCDYSKLDKIFNCCLDYLYYLYD